MSMTDVCCVCLEGYDDDNRSTFFACGHRMHTLCLQQYMRASANSIITTCPMCRRPIMDNLQAPPERPRPINNVIFLPLVRSNNTAPRSNQENERATDCDYRCSIAYTIGLMIMMLFIIMIIVIVSYIRG